MMVVALLHPLSGLPQIIDIYVNQNVAGVSILTWIGFMFFGSIYLYYGILHKLKPTLNRLKPKRLTPAHNTNGARH